MTSRESILIRRGRVIDPAQKLDAEMDIVLSDARVTQIGLPGSLRGTPDHVIDAHGLVVTPGLVDLHVHLRQPGQGYKETIASGTAAAAAGGFTSVCPMPNTTPVNDLPETTAWMQHPERGALVNVFPIAAATQGSEGRVLTDFRKLKLAGAVAISDDGKPILDDGLMRRALVLAHEVGLPVIQHAEDTRLTAGRPMNLGPTSFRLGLRGQPASAEARVVERDIALAAETGAHLHIAHISTAEALQAVRKAKRAGVQVTCEVAPHHFLFIDEDIGDYNTNLKMNPPLRSAADREAMLAGIADRTIDAIATDHAPHARYEKNVEFDRAAYGITGLEVALALAITRLHRVKGVPLSHIVALLSTNPARIIARSGRGTLAKGSYADVTIFDPKKRWTYDVSKSRSLSRNCPYDGIHLYGKVMYTIVAGEMIYGG
ncbi:MAG TPA: dihydroorotase [Clostridia bacterium]|nr:dihydroorotase [Clostridia bacterium]